MAKTLFQRQSLDEIIAVPDDIISVGVVAEKDYLYNGTRDLKEIFQREVKNNAWIEEHLAQGQEVGEYRVWPLFNLIEGDIATLKSEHIYCWITCNHVALDIMPGTYKYDQIISLYKPAKPID